MTEAYRPPSREERQCKHWWFDAWDWLVNRALSAAGSPVVRSRPGELAIDPHVHTMYSHCSISRSDQVILRAAALGFGGVGIMDHNHVEGIHEALRCADDLRRRGIIPEDFLVIPGVEVGSRQGHIGALFVQEELPGELSVEETVRIIHECGGLTVANHPYHSSGVGDALYDAPFDAVEVQCGAVFDRRLVKLNSDLASDHRLARLAKLGASDAHYLNAIGSCYTVFHVCEPTLEAVREAILNGSTSPGVSGPYMRVQRLLGGVSKLK